MRRNSYPRSQLTPPSSSRRQPLGRISRRNKKVSPTPPTPTQTEIHGAEISKKAVEELRVQGRSINEQFETLQLKGKDVHRTPGSNVIALKDIFNKLTASIPAEMEGFQDNLDAATALIKAAVWTDKNFIPEDPSGEREGRTKRRRS